MDREAEELFFLPCEGRYSIHPLVSETQEIIESLLYNQGPSEQPEEHGTCLGLGEDFHSTPP